MRAAMMVWTLLLAGTMTVSAQREIEPAVTEREDSLGVTPDPSKPRDAGTLFFAGMAGMVTGAFGGGLIGTEIDSSGGLEDADGAAIGGLVGTSLLIPTAIHLANHNRGNLRRSILASALIGGALLGLGVAAESGEIILAIPFVQLFTAMAIERNTTKPVSR